MLGQVNICRGIFQGDSLSSLLVIAALIPRTHLLRKTKLGYQTSKSSKKISDLLYMDDLKLYGKTAVKLESLVNTVRIFSSDISMEFGFDKCTTLAMYRGNMQKTEGIRLPNNSMIRSLELHEGYKYLGVLQADNIRHGEVKEQAKQEYLKRARKALKSKLNAGNVIQAINGWAIPVLRYTAGIVDWTSAELDDIDRKTRKLMTSNGALHPQSDIDRLYIPRSAGGRGMQSVKQVMLEEQINLAEYVQNRTEYALRDLWNEGFLASKG